MAADRKQGQGKFFWAYIPMPSSLTDLAQDIAPEHLNSRPNEDAIEHDPHITLHVFLPHLPDTTIIKQLFATKSFQVQLQGLGYFEGKEQDVLYAKVKDNEHLTALHQLLVRLFDKPWTYPTYQPHVTLAFLKAGKAAAYAKSIAFDQPITVDVTKVLFKEHDGKAEEAMTVPLMSWS